MRYIHKPLRTMAPNNFPSGHKLDCVPEGDRFTKDIRKMLHYSKRPDFDLMLLSIEHGMPVDATFVMDCIKLLTGTEHHNERRWFHKILKEKCKQH
jgi:hypothetical protein